MLGLLISHRTLVPFLHNTLSFLSSFCLPRASLSEKAAVCLLDVTLPGLG